MCVERSNVKAFKDSLQWLGWVGKRVHIEPSSDEQQRSFLETSVPSFMNIPLTSKALEELIAPLLPSIPSTSSSDSSSNPNSSFVPIVRGTAMLKPVSETTSIVESLRHTYPLIQLRSLTSSSIVFKIHIHAETPQFPWVDFSFTNSVVNGSRNFISYPPALDKTVRLKIQNQNEV